MWPRLIFHAKEMGRPSECTGEPRTLGQKRICVSERKQVEVMGRGIWSQKDPFEQRDKDQISGYLDEPRKLSGPETE